MVNAIDFAVRTVAGNVVRGAIAGEGGSEFLQVGSGEAVSLNISASSVLGYSRQGNDLVLQLIDGRQITLSSYFETNPGEDNRLYLSNDGEVAEVYLTDGGNGVLYANYGEADTWNKFSTVDDLRFTDDKQLAATAIAEDDTVGQALFVPGLAAASALRQQLLLARVFWAHWLVAAAAVMAIPISTQRLIRQTPRQTRRPIP
jgi:hypothetical protein